MVVGPFGKMRIAPLLRACSVGDVDTVVTELASYSKEQLSTERDSWAGSTALHWAAYAGHADIVRLLLDAQADPTATNLRDRAVPLHLAARYNVNTAALEMLVRAAPEATLNRPNTKGNTPLHEAAYEGRALNAAALLRLKADIEAVNNSDARGGLTPLLAAAEFGHLAIVRLLLREGASTETAPQKARSFQKFTKPSP